MCGSQMEDHDYNSNHAPVDAWFYNRDQYINR